MKMREMTTEQVAKMFNFKPSKEETFNELLTKFIKDCIDNHLIYTRAQLENNMDTIDARCINEKIDEYLDAVDAIKADNFFLDVPCFKEGSLRMSNTSYFYWNMTDINTDDKTMSIHLEMYSRTKLPKSTCTIWMQQLSADMHLTYDKENNRMDIDTDLEDELFVRIDIRKQLGWYDKTDIKLWNKVVDTAQKTSRDDRRSEEFTKSAQLFFSTIRVINKMLMMEKVQTKKGSCTKENTDSRKPRSLYGDAPQPRRLLRTVGVLSIRSEKIPRAINSSNVARQYKLASWKTRGHIRHLKNGKEIYIRESVHHRKGMKEPDNTPSSKLVVK